MMRYISLLTALLLIPAVAAAQTEEPPDDTTPGGETVTKSGTTAAQFLKLGVGARPIAMGGAFVAEASDLSALYWNPAGLAHLQGASVSLAHTEYLADVNYSFAAFGTSLGNAGTIAASILYLDSGSMDVRTIDQPEGTGEQFKVQDFAIQLSYARALTDRFAIGANAKYIQERIWHSSASTVALDIGTIFTTPYERLRLGASFSNFGPKMQMSGRDIVFSYDPVPGQDGVVDIVNSEFLMEEHPLPLLFRIGISWDAVHTSNHRIVFSTDAAHPNDNYEYVNLGAEYDFRGLVAIRAGYRNLFEADGEQGLTFGGGLNLRLDGGLRAGVDYAYADFGRLDATHWFTVNLGF